MVLTDQPRWGQIYILDSLLRYVPEKHEDAEVIAERIIVQLQHANSAVVLTTIKALLYFMNYMENRRLIDYVCKKMGPPLGAIFSLFLNSVLSIVSNSNPTIFWTGSPICRTAQHPPDHSKEAGSPQERCQSFLLQIQRSYIRQVGQAGNNVSISSGRECLRGASRAPRASYTV